MPQGCDFSCENKECPNNGKTIVMHGVWPTKSIDQAIADSGEDIERRQALEIRKAAGRTVALFVYPQDKHCEPNGYRLQLFCPSCLMVEDRDCGKDKEVAWGLSEHPPVCWYCGSLKHSLKTAIEHGLECPTCHKTMKQFFWFTK